MRRFLPILLLGCATTDTTEPAKIPVATETLDVSIAIGAISDSRLQDRQQKQIQISSAKVKNTISDVLTRSRRCREIVNLPIEITSTSLAGMLEAARSANCNFLIVGEIDQFDVLDLGANGRMAYSIPLEGLTFPVGVIVFLLSQRKSGIWTNGIVYDHTAEAVISVTLHVVDTETGKVVGHISNVVSKATKPINALVYGDLENPEDDWVDIGKELGLVALHNLSVDLIGRTAIEIQRIRGR
jgi:hypothetical protein